MSNLSKETTPDNASIEAVREKAVYWILSLEGSSGDELKSLDIEVEAWLKEDVRHQQVFNEMQGMWAATSRESQKQSRFKNGMLSILTVGFITITSLQMPWQYWNASYRTNVGEIKTVVLEDGTKATLNTNTAFNIEFDGHQRVVTLIRGELLVNVAHKNNQPFKVVFPHGSATALGTLYSTRLQEDRTTVKVYESKVKVSSRQNLDRSIVINAGQSVSLNKETISQKSVLTEKLPDWSRKKLIFHNVPLSEVIERISHYHTGKISAKADVLQRNLYFTGLLPAENSDAALSLVAESLGLELHQLTDYNIWFENSSHIAQ